MTVKLSKSWARLAIDICIGGARSASSPLYPSIVVNGISFGQPPRDPCSHLGCVLRFDSKLVIIIVELLVPKSDTKVGEA